MDEKVELLWTEPALSDLDDIASFIARENPKAAAKLIRRVLATVERLVDHPSSGRWVPELLPRKAYREVIVPPCRIIYRREGHDVLFVHVMRGERLLRVDRLF
jgi:toxin ParE1/3/4